MEWICTTHVRQTYWYIYNCNNWDRVTQFEWTRLVNSRSCLCICSPTVVTGLKRMRRKMECKHVENDFIAREERKKRVCNYALRQVRCVCVCVCVVCLVLVNRQWIVCVMNKVAKLLLSIIDLQTIFKVLHTSSSTFITIFIEHICSLFGYSIRLIVLVVSFLIVGKLWLSIGWRCWCKAIRSFQLIFF